MTTSARILLRVGGALEGIRPAGPERKRPAHGRILVDGGEGMTERLTEADLQRIERAGTGHDMPNLISEVRRLRALIAMAHPQREAISSRHVRAQRALRDEAETIRAENSR
jgi:hypothetical protein